MEKGHKKEKSIALIAELSEKYDEVKIETTKAASNKNVCEGRNEATKDKRKIEDECIIPQLKMSLKIWRNTWHFCQKDSQVLSSKEIEHPLNHSKKTLNKAKILLIDLNSNATTLE